MSNLQFRKPAMPGRPSWRTNSDPRLEINSGVDDYMRDNIDKQCDEIAARTATKLVALFEFPEQKCERFKDMMAGVAQYHYYQIANKVYAAEQRKANDAVDRANKNAEETIKKVQENFRQEKYDLNQWVDQYQKTANDAEDRVATLEKELGKLQQVEEQLTKERKDRKYLEGDVEEKDLHVKQLQEEIDEWKEKYEKVDGDKREADAVEMGMRHQKEAVEREMRQLRTDTEEKHRQLREAVESAEEAKKKAIKGFESSKEELKRATDAKDELRLRVREMEKAKKALEREKAELESNINGLREELQRAGNDAKADQKKALSKLRKEKDQEIGSLNKKIESLSKEVGQLQVRQKDDEEQKTVARNAPTNIGKDNDREVKRLTEDKKRLEEEVGLLRAREQNDDKLKNVEKELANLKAWRAEKAEEIEEAKRGQLDPGDKTLFQVVPPVLKEVVRLRKGANLSDHGITSDYQLEAFGRLLGPLEIDEYTKLREKVEAITSRASKDAEALKGSIQKVLQGMGEAHAEHARKNQEMMLNLKEAANLDVVKANGDAQDAKKELKKLKEDLQATEDKRKELNREKSELSNKLNKLESSLKELSKEKDDLELQMRDPQLEGEDFAALKKKYADLMTEKATLENRCTENTQQIEKKQKELKAAQGHLKEARDHIKWIGDQNSEREMMTKHYEDGATKSSEMLANLGVNLKLADKAKKMALERAAKAEKELQGIKDEVEPPECADLKTEVRNLIRFRKAHEEGQEAIKKLDELQTYQDAIERILETNAVLDLKQSAAIMDMYAQRATRMCSQYEQRRRDQPDVEDPELFSKIAKNRKEGRNLEKVRDRLRVAVRFIEDLLDKSKNKVKPKGSTSETEPSTPMSIAPDTPSRPIDVFMGPISLAQRNQQAQVHSGGRSLFTLVNWAALLFMLAAIVAEGQKYGQWKSANSYTRGLYAEQRNYVCASVPQMVFFTDWIWASVTTK